MSFALGGSGDVVVAPLPSGAEEKVFGNHLVVSRIVYFLVEALGAVTSNVVTRTPPLKLKREDITIECDAQRWRGVKVAFRPRPGDHVAIRAPGNILRWFTVESAEERSEAESAEESPEVEYVVTCTDADQLDVETLALNITRKFVRALRPIIALAGTCRTVRSAVVQAWQRTKLAQLWGKSLASYIYERLVRGIDDPTASEDSIEWLNQKKGPNKVPDLGFEPLLNSVCAMAVLGFHNSTEDATEVKPPVRFPEAYEAALTQMWHHPLKEIRNALQAWAIALFYWRVSLKGGPGTAAKSVLSLGKAALAAPPEVLSDVFSAMLDTALSRAKADDKLGIKVAVQDMLRFFNGKTMTSYNSHHPLTPTAWKHALVVIEELERTGVKEPQSFATALGHTCVPVHLWLCTAIGQVPAETIEQWFRRATAVGFRFVTPSDTAGREINKLLMMHWWQPGIRSFLRRFAPYAKMVNDLFRKAAHTATPPNEEPALFTVAFAFGQLLSPSNMTTLPESKEQEYKTVQVYKEFNVRFGGWRNQNGDQPFPVNAAKELRLYRWNREPPAYLQPIPGWTVKQNRPPASETATSSGKKPVSSAPEEEQSRKRRSDASEPEAKKKARAPSEAGPAE